MKYYPENSIGVDNLYWASLRKDFSFGTKFIYLIGGRGWGKTYSVKTYVLKQFMKHKKKFAWVRTTDRALENLTTQQFFGRQENLKELGIEKTEIKKNIVYINKEIAGYLFSVSTFHNIKGSDYDVSTCVWDEFLKAKGERPVSDKRGKFNDLLESVMRETKGRVILISNSTNQYDEMFEPFNLKLNGFGCYLFRDKDSVIHYMDTSKSYKQRKLGGLASINMNEIEKDYAYGNKFIDYDTYGTFEKLVYKYSIIVDDNRLLNFYVAPEGFMYCCNKEPPCSVIYASDVSFVNKLIKKLPPLSRKYLCDLFNGGLMRFDTGYSRSMFLDCIVN